MICNDSLLTPEENCSVLILAHVVLSIPVNAGIDFSESVIESV